MTRIHVFNAHPTYKVNKSIFKHLVQGVFHSEGTRTAACSLIFVDDKDMTDLNGTFLRHWYVTDVLSFPLHDNDDDGIEGEVYVNIDQARRQARDYRVPYKSELARLVVHGVLHLLGYQDSTKRQKARMSQLEEQYLLLLH